MSNHKAFTYIEILVSLSVLAMVSIVGISSFQAFFSKQSITRIQEKIGNIVRSLDIDIDAGNISSYTLAFSSGASSLVANIDYYKSPQLISLQSFDYLNLSGALVTNNTSTGFWETKIYLDNVLKNNYFNNGSGGTINLSLGNYTGFETIRVNSIIGNIQTNSLSIYRLDYAKDEKDNPENTNINSIKSGTYFDMMYLENILGKKTMYTFDGSNTGVIDSADIGLIKGSTEVNFTIKPY